LGRMTVPCEDPVTDTGLTDRDESKDGTGGHDLLMQIEALSSCWRNGAMETLSFILG